MVRRRDTGGKGQEARGGRRESAGSRSIIQARPRGPGRRGWGLCRSSGPKVGGGQEAGGGGGMQEVGGRIQQAEDGRHEAAASSQQPAFGLGGQAGGEGERKGAGSATGKAAAHKPARWAPRSAACPGGAARPAPGPHAETAAAAAAAPGGGRGRGREQGHAAHARRSSMSATQAHCTSRRTCESLCGVYVCVCVRACCVRVHLLHFLLLLLRICSISGSGLVGLKA